jgi:ATP-dependent DNA ligase
MIKPMLAYKVGKKDVDWSEKVFIQPKLDGVRCVFTKDGAFSRTGKQFKNVAHIEDDLKDFFKQYPYRVLDGELYNHELKDDFEKIISLVRKQKPSDENRLNAKELVQFHVYDFMNFTVLKNLTKDVYEDRFNWLVRNLPISRTMTLIKNTSVDSYDEAKMLHDVHLAQGYEGSMLRLNKPYECKRSYNLQKFKDFSDTEATIVGYETGKGKRTGTLGKFYMQDDEGIQFGCPPGKGYSYKDLADMLENVHDYIGQRATFTYFQRTKAGSYRHPLFKALRNYE